MKWTKWSDEISVPFDAARAVYLATSGTMDSKMVGNGEHLFAAHTGGEVSSDIMFDVLGPSGEKYEVKTLGNFRFNFYKTYAKDVYDRFISITNELMHALDGSAYDKFHNRVIDIDSKSYIGVQKILGRDFKNGRPPEIGLAQIARVLCFDKITTGDYADLEVTIGESAYATIPQIIKMCSIINLSLDIDFTEIDTVYSKLEDSCFDNPDEITDLWKSIVPSEVLLTHADHLVIVHKERGYIILSREEIDRFVVFTGFSKGEAHFKTTKELKEVSFEIVERNPTGVQLNFAKWFGDYHKEKQESTVRGCDCLSF